MVRSLHIKNNIIFRIDYSSNKTERDHHIHNITESKKKRNIKSALSQTMYSAAKYFRK